MRVRVQFYSYFKDLAGTPELFEEVGPGCRLRELRQRVFARYPRLAPMEKSMLSAVGVDYQDGDYLLAEGDEVAFFPPVQGG